MRTFLALDLSAEAKQIVEQLQKPLLNLDSIKTTRPEQCHLTLKFLGEIDEPQREAFSASLSEIRRASFQLGLTNLGAFPGARHPRVIWLGVSSTSELAALAQAVDQATSAIALDKPFAAHITIARAKGPGVKFDPALLDVAVPACAYAVTEFVLYRSVLTSSGPKYEALQKFALLL